MGLFNIFNKKQSVQEKALKLLLEAQEDATKYFEKIGPIILERQQPDRSDFGLCESNPICTTSLMATEAYLKRLCTKDGRKFTWPRYHSIRTQLHGLEDVGEDVYTLYLDEEIYAKIYVVPYIGMSKFPPAGMIFCDDDRDWDLEREAFSQGLDVEGLIKIRELKKELEEEKRKIQEEAKRKEEEHSQWLANNVAEAKASYPSLNLEIEMENAIFSTLVLIEYDLKPAYEYVHKAEYFDKVEFENSNVNYEFYTASYYYEQICELESDKKPVIRKQNIEDLTKEAEDRQVSVDDLIELQNVLARNAKELWDRQLLSFQKLASQAEQTKRLFPLFDLQDDWRNETFQKLIKHFEMHIAHEILHFSKYYVSKDSASTSSMQNAEHLAEKRLFCRKCGESLVLDSAFCHRCGTKVFNP